MADDRPDLDALTAAAGATAPDRAPSADPTRGGDGGAQPLLRARAPEAFAALEDDPDLRAQLERLMSTARLLDSRIRVPGTDFTFGVDALLGLIPGVGAPAGMVLSVTVMLQAIVAGATPATVLRMVGIAALDALVGMIPVVGAISDFIIKANDRNARIATAQLADPEATTADSRRTIVLAVIALFAALAAVFWVLVLLTILIVRWLT